MDGIFSGGFDPARVNIPGVVLLITGACVALFADRLAKRFGSGNLIKIIGLVICAGGALLAILG